MKQIVDSQILSDLVHIGGIRPSRMPVRRLLWVAVASCLLCCFVGCSDIGPGGSVVTTDKSQASAVEATESAIPELLPSTSELNSDANLVDKATSKESESSNTAPVDEATDWPFFRGDWAGRAYVAESKLPETLDVLWEYWEPKNSYDSSPVVDAGRVVVADLDGAIRCLDLRDKTLLWKTTTKFGFVASPSIYDRKIYIGDNDGMFRQLDLMTGEIGWVFQANQQIDSTANFHDDQVIFGSYDSCLYSLNRTDGTLKWKYESPDQIRCSIVVDNQQTAIAGCDAVLHVIDVNDGKEGFGVELSSQTAVAPTMLGSRTYFGMESGEFVCIDMNEKTILWTWKDAKRDGPIRGSAAVTDDRIVFGTRANQVVCLNRETGELIWQRNTKRSVEASAIVVGKRVYIGDTAGNLMVLSLESGELIQSLELSGGIVSSPALAGDRLIVTTQEGIVYCLGNR